LIEGEFERDLAERLAGYVTDLTNDSRHYDAAQLGTQPTGGLCTTAQTCARQLRDAFLAAPTTILDQSCLATSHGAAFDLP